MLKCNGKIFELICQQTDIDYVLLSLLCLPIRNSETRYRSSNYFKGILQRHSNPPPGSDESQWRWNDRALTYRPRGAWYDQDTAVVVEGFDHT